MTRYLDATPSRDEITDAVEELFCKASVKLGVGRLSALVPVDTTMEKGYRVLNLTVDFEMEELCRLVNYFSAVVDQEENPVARAPTQILLYCHVFESDFPMTVLWNLHRLLVGEGCSWTFHRITEKGKCQICKYPRERVEEMEKLSVRAKTSLGSVLRRMWHPTLRNGFSHSQYFVSGDAVTCTGRLSPISRTGSGIGEGGSKSYTFRDIDDLFQAVGALLEGFVASYDRAVAPFKDGSAYAIQGGRVYWDASRTKWQWEQNRPSEGA